MLRDAGAVVTAAASADAALRLLGEGLVADLIVSDVGMPDQDGYESDEKASGPRRLRPS